MKTRFFREWKTFVIFGVAIALYGCVDKTSRMSAQSTTSVVQASPAPAPLRTDLTPSPVVDDQPSATATPATALQAPGAPVPVSTNAISPDILEIAKLAQSNVSEEILLTYIRNSPRSFEASADEILYLNDLGVSESVITAMVSHRPVSAASANPAPAVAQSPAPAPVGNVPYAAPPQDPVVTEEVLPPQQQQENVSYFYNSLAPYGSWVTVPNYGVCWQPTVVVVNPRWRPYCDRGRWLYTDSGWYWHSDYSWGWAPFHYGRWHCDSGAGWVWVPDRTWGASWVSWRYSDTHCGWAPLPPVARFDVGFGFRYRSHGVGIGFDFGLRDDHYVFLPSSRLCDRTPYRYYLPHHEARNVYQRSTVINNYIVGNNNTIINEGVGRDRIASVSRTEIKKVPIKDMSRENNYSHRGEKMDRDGKSLLVYRPSLGGEPIQKAGFASGGSGNANSNPISKRGSESANPSSAHNGAGRPNAGGGSGPINKNSSAFVEPNTSISSPANNPGRSGRGPISTPTGSPQGNSISGSNVDPSRGGTPPVQKNNSPAYRPSSQTAFGGNNQGQNGNASANNEVANQSGRPPGQIVGRPTPMPSVPQPVVKRTPWPGSDTGGTSRDVRSPAAQYNNNSQPAQNNGSYSRPAVNGTTPSSGEGFRPGSSPATVAPTQPIQPQPHNPGNPVSRPAYQSPSVHQPAAQYSNPSPNSRPSSPQAEYRSAPVRNNSAPAATYVAPQRSQPAAVSSQPAQHQQAPVQPARQSSGNSGSSGRPSNTANERQRQ